METALSNYQEHQPLATREALKDAPPESVEYRLYHWQKPLPVRKEIEARAIELKGDKSPEAQARLGFLRSMLYPIDRPILPASKGKRKKKD